MPPASHLEPSPLVDLTHREAIRKRPGMYVGSTTFFGFIQYLVCPFALLLERRLSRIDVTVLDHGFAIDSDVQVEIGQTVEGQITPFEVPEEPGGSDEMAGCVLNALSGSLVIRTAGGGSAHTLTYQRGERIAHATVADPGVHTRLEFAPDLTIFTVTSTPLAVFESYLRRLSYLHPRIQFSLTSGGETQTFAAPGGIRDLFDSIVAPYQLVHPPIQIAATDGDLQVELVFAYHSWFENWIWSFINNGRAIEGGTHETGLHKALDQLYRALKLPKKPKRGRNGVIAVMAVIYPGAVWQGCLKQRVDNPELTERVANLVVTAVMAWMADHPEVAEQVRTIERFHFAETWYH